MSENLVSRIEKLESENRRLKRWGGGLLGALGVAGLLSFTAPRLCDTVTAERFLVQDSRGRTRIRLNAYSTNSPSMTFMDERGKTAAEFLMTEAGQLNLQLFKDGKRTGQPIAFNVDEAHGHQGAAGQTDAGDVN